MSSVVCHQRPSTSPLPPKPVEEGSIATIPAICALCYHVLLMANGTGLAGNSVARVIDQLLRADLVIVEELGSVPLDDTGTQLRFRRLLHHAAVVVMESESVRMRHAKVRRGLSMKKT